jgi:hypothetical protein
MFWVSCNRIHYLEESTSNNFRFKYSGSVYLTVIFVISCIALGCWIKSVKNQVWYALGSCNGNAEYLIEMILAIAEHVAGNHTFPGIAGLNGCGSETKNLDPV